MTMPSTCCVVGCHSRSHRRGKRVDGIGFYSFPTFKRDDPLPRVRDTTRRRRLAWVSAIRRVEITFESKIPAHVKVCSRHFHQGKPAYEMLEGDADWAPSLHLGHTEVKASNLGMCTRRQSRAKRQQDQDTAGVQAPAPDSSGHEAETVAAAPLKQEEPSSDVDSPDFVPSVFPCSEQSAKKRGRKKRVHHAADVDTQPKAESPEGLQPPMEEIQMPSPPPVPQEEEMLPVKTETETTPIESQTVSSPHEVLLSFKAEIPELDKRSPIVLLKRVYVPTSGYHCNKCSQNFPSGPELITHIQQYEETVSMVCEKCGKFFTRRANFYDHQCFQEASFKCNICHRAFTTSHNLKRHKLLHVKDGRKCKTCGVLFCQRHSHVLFLPQAASVTECDEEPDATGHQNDHSDLTSEDHELGHTADQVDDAQSTMTLLPPSLSRATIPPLHILSEPPVPAFTVPVKRRGRLSTSCSKNPVPFSQFGSPSFYKCRTGFQRHPRLPPSLRLFSPRYLTSALLKVERDYEYILSKPRHVKSNIVKEEPCELPLVFPHELRVEHIKQERTDYDLELEL